MYASKVMETKHNEAIEYIKSVNGLIRDEHRVGGMIQISHVGRFKANDDDKNPKLVALIDGVLFCLNPIVFSREEDDRFDINTDVSQTLRVSRWSVGGNIEDVSLSMEDRCKNYNEDEYKLGTIVEIIPVRK